MPNRILKESICTSDTIDQLSPQEEVFFYRLLVACDDYGRMDGRPRILRARCFPLRVDVITDDAISEWLDTFERVGLVERYTVNGQLYIQVTTWERHQQVRAQRSKFPAPADSNTASASNGYQLISDDIRCPRNPNPNPDPNPYPDTIMSAPAVPEPSPQEPKPKPVKHEYSADFEQFWTIYPRKEEKRGAFKSWNARLKGGALPDQIIAAARNYATATADTEPQWIKLPATFLGPDRDYDDWINGIPPGRINNNGQKGARNVPANLRPPSDASKRVVRALTPDEFNQRYPGRPAGVSDVQGVGLASDAGPPTGTS